MQNQQEHSTYETIQVEYDGPIFTLTLHRPEKRNALNRKLREEGVHALSIARANPAVRAIIIWGGEKIFAGGADLGEMAAARPLQMLRLLNTAQNVDLWGTVATTLQPTIAAVAGGAFGGGCELAMACDFRIAAENAIFGQPEVSLGILPGAGGTQRLARLIGMTKAKEVVLLNEFIKAPEALSLGLVNKVVSVENLLSEAKLWARKLADKAPQAVRLAKLMMDRGYDLEINTALAMESLAFAELFGTHDQQEGAQAFLEKRTPHFTGE